MQHRNRNRNAKAPLIVREVILPNKKEPCPSRCSRESVPKDLLQPEENASGGCLIGTHEVKSIGRLFNLKKQVQEPYYEGINKEKSHKKKIKHQKVTHCLNVSLFSGSQHEFEGSNSQTQSEDSISFEDIIQRRQLVQKVQKYEKTKKYHNHSNDVRQRLVEEKYIQQQEKLLETWLQHAERKNLLKQDSLLGFRQREKKSQEVAMSSKDESVPKVKQKQNIPREKVVDDLGEELLEKLIFINDSSDEQE